MLAPPDRDQVLAQLDRLHDRHRLADDAEVASYYASGRGYYEPLFAGPERDQFAIALAAPDGASVGTGDCDLRFPLHSISKVFVFGLALEDHGRDEVLRRVGVEPTGDAYNSIVFDERHNRPHNPMVNTGALATSDLIRGATPAERLERVLERLRAYAGSPSLDVDGATLAAELETADRNRGTAYLMRAQGMLSGDVEETLGLYLQTCSVMVTCRELAMMAATLANGGVNPLTGQRALAREHVRDVLSVMYTCGMYDFAGQWAYEVGVPAKSGVSGGVLAAIPGTMGVAVFSPGLDEYGNSVRGTRVCRDISARLGLHVFALGDAGQLVSGPAAHDAHARS